MDTSPLACPKCRRHSVRAKINLFLDIPFSLWGRLSKANLRKQAVKVEGADWPKALLYCNDSGCGWVEK